MKKLLALLFIASTMLISCEQNGVNEPDNPKDAPSFTFTEGTEVNPTIGYVGGELTFSFISNCSWTVEENDDWINISPTSGNQGNHTLAISVAKNTTGEERLSKITILYGVDSHVVINLTQEANEVFETDSEGNYIVEADGGTVDVKVTTNLEYDVLIPDEASAWLSLADTRTVREETLTFTVEENETFDERTAKVILKGSDGEVLQSITFKQKGVEKIFDTDSDGNYIVEAVGGKVEVKVTTNLEYMVEIPEDAMAWLSIADTRTIIREETLTFIVAENTLFDERSTTVKLKGANGEVLQNVYFKQKEYEGTIKVDEEYIVKAEGGELEVNLSTDIDFTISIPEEAKSWISIVETRAMHNESIVFNIAINEDVKERTATINLLNAKGNNVESFTIRQMGADAVLELQNQYSISNKGGEFEVVVTTNLNYDVEISANATSWLSLVATRATRTDRLIFYASTNDNEEHREAIVRLLGENNEELQVINVYQRGNIYEFSYKTNDGKPLSPNTTEGFGGEFMENIYDESTGEGVLRFKGVITTIPEQALRFCDNLTWINIPEGITTIGASAFSGCLALEEITIPASVTYVGDKAFVNCPCKATILCSNVSFSNAGFTDVIIPDSVTTIGNSAFSGCDSLTSVTIGDSVTSIGDDAFYDCDSLTSITIPDSVTTVGNRAFYDCDSLTSVTIPDSVTTIGSEAFCSCSSLTSVTIGDSVTTIGQRAFYNCDGLTSVTIGKGVTSIGSYAFAGCTGKLIVNCNIPSKKYDDRNGFYNAEFSEVIICNGVTTIGEYAFYECDSLTSITIGDSVTTIGSEAFYGCKSLTCVTIGKGVTSIGSYAFAGCTGKLIVNCNIPSRYERNITGHFYVDVFYGAKFSEVVICNGVTTIGEYAFSECDSLTSVIIPDSVTTVGNRAFYECDSLTSVTIPDSVTTIGSEAFYRCYSLTSVTIGDSVTTIGDYAFYQCDSLTSVTIGDSVTTIGDYAFYQCYSLTSVYCKATTPPSLGGSFVFYYNASDRKIYVPSASVSAYKSAAYWSNYADYIVGYNF